jgi:Domain of unknown function (DUF4351)
LNYNYFDLSIQFRSHAMTQTPFDQMSKQYLEEFLEPFGSVQRQYEVPGEAKFVDVWFVPDQLTDSSTAKLGILGRMAAGMCLLEPYRNAPTRTEVRVSVMKLVWVQEDERRKAEQDERRLNEDSLPKLWILASTVSQPVLQESEAKERADWCPGVYFVPEIFKAAIVAIDELPQTKETLWLRILGRDGTQTRAIREVLALPPEHPRRSNILRLLASWKIRIDLGELMDFSEQEEGLVALSEAFLEWEQQTEARSQRSLVFLLLEQRVGALSQSVKDKITTLSLPQIEALAIALLNFSSPDELEAWLDSQAGN